MRLLGSWQNNTDQTNWNMGEDNYTFEDPAVIMPEGWKTKAKELGALQGVREIKTPEDLLKLIFFYID
jgi:hypothetical protein